LVKLRADGHPEQLVCREGGRKSSAMMVWKRAVVNRSSCTEKPVGMASQSS